MEVAEQKQAAAATAMLKATDLAFVKCECCGLTEECTEEYIKRVRDRYSGRWICGLCAEAVKDELLRSEKNWEWGGFESAHEFLQEVQELKPTWKSYWRIDFCCETVASEEPGFSTVQPSEEALFGSIWKLFLCSGCLKRMWIDSCNLRVELDCYWTDHCWLNNCCFFRVAWKQC